MPPSRSCSQSDRLPASTPEVVHTSDLALSETVAPAPDNGDVPRETSRPLRRGSAMAMQEGAQRSGALLRLRERQPVSSTWEDL